MNITVEAVDGENSKEYKTCIFCHRDTVYRAIEHNNEAVCPVCSVMYGNSDVRYAPFKK